MSVINTNITAKIAQGNLGSSQKALSTAMERLSSGLRINSAKDDSAGQAIANRMTAQISGLSQAQRNANDGISIAQTAEGALDEVNTNIQRIRELAVQAVNGTNSFEDLQSIQSEIGQRLGEVDRISSQTDFNGTKVLSADKALSIQVGANDGETIDINLQKVTSETLGLNEFNVAGPNGVPTEVTGGDLATTFNDSSVTSVAVVDGGSALASRLGVDAGSVSFDTDSVFQDKDGNVFAKIDITAADQSEVDALSANGFKVEEGVADQFFVRVDPKDATVSGGTATFDLDAANIEFTDIQEERSANPLAGVDAALQKVDGFRSELGAVQNRLGSAISNLATNEQNLTSARSRIQDADFADEVSNLTRSQILQQAGTSVLAQANQLPQSALSLLG